MKKILECVPNFSEGRDLKIIKQISDAIENVEGISLLDIDPGKAANRTVVTFVGEPDQVIEAAYRAIKIASEIIDMSLHHGEHPRIGATDVCPLVPISGITMEETVYYARKLAERVGNELNIPVYCYENAAFKEERRNLANIRHGEYEGLPQKLKDPGWKPDYGPAVFNKKTGATVVGARDFLVAYNVNLNTTSTRWANAIAFDVREKGRVKKEGGNVILDNLGNPVYVPGKLKSVKAIGWYIEEYGIAQISMNLTNISVTSIHQAFEEVCKSAEQRGIRVTGSEIIGLVPLKAMLDAGRYFLNKQKRSAGVSDREIIRIAVKSLGLDDLYPFEPEEKIIEYKMSEQTSKLLVGLTLTDFMNDVASESPAPGGGSVSAYIGSLGVALGTMVANISSHKRGWEARWEEFSLLAERGKELQEKLLYLVDEDSKAFNGMMDAVKLPKNTEDEKIIRQQKIQQATRLAIEVPCNVMQTAFAGFEIVEAMAESGNPNSVSDAGVGAIALRSSIWGAWLNILINSEGFEDKEYLQGILEQGNGLLRAAGEKETQILNNIQGKMIKKT